MNTKIEHWECVPALFPAAPKVIQHLLDLGWTEEYADQFQTIGKLPSGLFIAWDEDPPPSIGGTALRVFRADSTEILDSEWIKCTHIASKDGRKKIAPGWRAKIQLAERRLLRRQ